MARGYIRRRSKNRPDRWEIITYLGINPATGGKKYRSESFTGTRREALRRRDELERLKDGGEHVDPSRETTAEFLRRWLRDYAEVQVRPKTLQEYRKKLELYVIPALGNIRLDRLAPVDIQGFESACLRRGLSPRTVLHCHRLLSQALKWGVRMRVLFRNPADDVDPPRPRRYEARFLDWDEVRVLLEAARGSRYHDLIWFDLLTGLRRSEILALRWQNVDLEQASISVVQSLSQLEAGRLETGPPKSGQARAVPLPDPAARLIFGVLEQAGGKAAVRPGDPVFQAPGGGPLLPDTVTQAFGRLVRRAGFPGLRFHDLRHTHASLLLREGVHPKVVSERLGHASIEITMDLYSHVMPTIQEGAAVKLSEKWAALMEVDWQKDWQKGRSGVADMAPEA